LLKLIERYIQEQEPISSRKLQESLDIALSSAAIRYYFKQLSEHGSIKKAHSSGGRIPTTRSLREFWRQRLRDHMEMELVDTGRVERVATRKRIFCEYYTFENRTLTQVERCGGHLLCHFGDREFVVRYNRKLEAFLEGQIGRKAFALSEDCRKVGLVQFAKDLRRFLQDRFEIFAIEEIVDICRIDPTWAKVHLPSYMDGSLLHREQEGLFFEADLLRYKFRIVLGEGSRHGEMLLLGRLYRDFDGFINLLKGVENG